MSARRSRGVGLALVLALGAALAWFRTRGAERAAASAGPPPAVEHAPSSVEPAQPTVLAAPAPPPSESVERVAPAQDAAPADPLPGEALLRVRVLALEDGRGLAGVELRLETTAGEPLPGAAGRSDAQGQAEFRLPAKLECVLHARPAEPGLGARVPVRPIAAGELRTVVVEVFASPDRPWFARIVDAESGRPVAGARVALAASGTLEGPAADSRQDGAVRLELGSRVESFVHVRAAGYGDARVHAGPGHESEAAAQRIELLREASVEVLLTDRERRPLSDFAVQLWLDGADAPGLERLAAARARDERRTGPDGSCRFEGLRARVPLALAVDVRGTPLRVLELAAGLAPGEHRVLDWALGTGCALAGQVLDQQGEPVADLGLWLVPAAPGRELLGPELARELVRTTESDGEGRFRFEDVSEGEWCLGPAPRAGEARWAPERDPARLAAPATSQVRLSAGEVERELVLRVWRGLYIRGRVVRAGGEAARGGRIEAACGARVFAALADLEGRFELGPLLPGDYEVRARPGSPGRRVPAGTEELVLVVE